MLSDQFHYTPSRDTATHMTHYQLSDMSGLTASICNKSLVGNSENRTAGRIKLAVSQWEALRGKLQIHYGAVVQPTLLTLGNCKHKVTLCCEMVVQLWWAKQTRQQRTQTPRLHAALYLRL